MKSEESIVQYGGGSLDYVCKQVCMHVCMFCMYACMNVCMYIVVTFPRQSNMRPKDECCSVWGM